MRQRTWDFTAQVSDGKYFHRESVGWVRAGSEAEARQAIADQIRQDGIRKGHRRPWSATHINLT